MTHTCHEFDPANPPVQWVQNGWEMGIPTADGTALRIPIMELRQPQWLDLPCQYSNHRTDPACPDSCPRKTT